ncbi:MAG: hypothetical protein R3292_02090, partial [Alcanivorax sp.]|nr:hypothetical protein [Alcanivorax sp.]
MPDRRSTALAKVPEITLAFWVVKILATTLGETFGDTLSMSLGLGYLASTGIFALLFMVTLFFQIRRAFHFIDNGLVGECPSMRTLRENLWNHIFTCDIQLYETT